MNARIKTNEIVFDEVGTFNDLQDIIDNYFYDNKSRQSPMITKIVITEVAMADPIRKMSDLQLSVYNLIYENPDVTINYLDYRLEISQGAINSVLKRLLELGKVELIGDIFYRLKGEYSTTYTTKNLRTDRKRGGK